MGSKPCSLVVAASDHPWGRSVELAEIGEGFAVAWVQIDRLFELQRARFARRVGGEKLARSAFAQRAAEPEVIGGILPVEVHGLFAFD